MRFFFENFRVKNKFLAKIFKKLKMKENKYKNEEKQTY
jgi:hypothetical protein